MDVVNIGIFQYRSVLWEPQSASSRLGDSYIFKVTINPRYLGLVLDTAFPDP